MAGAVSRPARLWWAGGLAGLAVALAVLALLPANWVAHWVAGRSDGRVLLGDARGTLWNGSAVLGFHTPESGAWSLPGRLAWRVGLTGPLGVRVALSDPDVFADVVALRLGWRPGSGTEFEVGPGAARLPLGLMALAGAPFNTLQPQGLARLRWDTLGLAAGALAGQGSVDLERLGLAVSTLRPLGDYRIVWELGRRGPAGQGGPDRDGLRWSLATLEGILQLEGRGDWSMARGARFAGRAAPRQGAAPELVRQVQTLLDVLGPREAGGSGVRIRAGVGAEQLG